MEQEVQYLFGERQRKDYDLIPDYWFGLQQFEISKNVYKTQKKRVKTRFKKFCFSALPLITSHTTTENEQVLVRISHNNSGLTLTNTNIYVIIKLFKSLT